MTETALSRPNVLIVDDLNANLVALKRLLTKADVEVVTASSGNEALALSLSRDFALVLLDVQMPDIDGYEVAELLRGEERTRDVPIIFVTAAHKDDHDRLRGYGTGAVDFIEKPIDDVMLLSKVRVFIELDRSRREQQRLLGLLRKANGDLGVEIEERKLREEETHLLAGTIFAASAEAIVVTDADNNVVAVNPAFTAITGYRPAEIIGMNPRILQSGRHDAAFFTAMWAQLSETDHWQGDIWNRRKSGEVYPEWLSISLVRNAAGGIIKHVGIFSDITERKTVENQIRDLAFFDPLTRLPNRRLLTDRLRQALATSSRNGCEGALLFVDLDNFKTVNDTQGHDKGDLLLQQVAERLSTNFREADTVARIGGDEFVIVLADLSADREEAAAQAGAVGEKVLAALGKPYQISGHEFRCTPSIGITLFGEQPCNRDP